MTSVDVSETSEDVTEFLRRIKELGDKRDREDEERTRKLEQDILEGRQQRAARRAERARSLSPEKSSPSPTPQSKSSTRVIEINGRTPLPSLHESPSIVPSEAAVPVPTMKQEEADMPKTFASPTPTSQDNRPSSPSKASPSLGVTPTRSGTLSWQQRPASLRGPRSRPLSVVGDSFSPSETESTKDSVDEEPASRDQIAKALGAKDPSWFRQTADRGVGSAAYRKNQDQIDESSSSATDKVPRYGMSKELAGSVAAATSPSPPSTKSWSPSTSASVRGSATATDRLSSNTSSSGPGTGEFGSPLPLRTSQRLPPTASFQPEPASRPSRELDSEPALYGRERSTSPTKGMGGFVQSAMMKRSDSVTKRWSAQTPSSPSRQNSNAGSRRAYAGSRDVPDTAAQAKEDLEIQIPGQNAPEEAPKSPERHTKAGAAADPSTPTSPSKRWSPVKSSWLESALNKPESPKPKSNHAQPSWMVDLNKSKQQRAATNDVELGEQTLKSPLQPTPSLSNAGEKNTGALPETSINPPLTKPKPELLSDRPRELAATVQSEPVKASTSSPSSSTSKIATGPVQTPPTSSTKAKPATPPKKDFRSTLKSRELPPDSGKKEELEFQNVFGKLRRTQTEKYVAPDELKNNILRGKAGLAVTDGPQKTPRKDEFKESLIERKATIKAKAADSSSPAAAGKASSPSQVESIPEAIAKKKALSSSSGSSGNILPRQSSAKEASAAPDRGLAENVKPEADGLPTPKPTVSAGEAGGVKGKNFNVALAGILARGPPSPAPPSRPLQTVNPSPQASADRAGKSGTSSGQLQHMTKARAKGPKRRLPKADASSVEASTASPSTISTGIKQFPSAPQQPQQSRSAVQNQKPATPPKSARLAAASSPPGSKLVINKDEIPQEQTSSASPPVPSKPTKSFSSISSPTGAPDKIAGSDPVGLGIGLGKKQHGKKESISVKDRSAMWDQKDASQPVKPTKPSAQIELPTQNREVAEERSGPLVSKERSANVAESSAETPKFAATSQISAVYSAEQSVVVKTPASPRKTQPEIATKSSNVPQTSEAGQLFRDFFQEAPVTTGNLSVDTQAVLSSNQSNESKFKTLGNTTREITGDGKTVPVQQDLQHILYSDKMYICLHAVEDSAGRPATHVFFWAGSAVSDATIEDVQLFARKAAKDSQAPLVAFRQGKENAEFFQALGGIVVTRDASSRANTRPYMLCGRRHLGNIAFDEVELSTGKLCSGFPYIVSSGRGSVYIWKGHGCNVDELSCARLIGMGLEPESTTTEIEQGNETKEFLAVFPPGSPTSVRSADFWKLKPKHESYSVRLFHVDHSLREESKMSAAWQLVRRSSQHAPAGSGQAAVTEIVPFCQTDLEPEGIYVLDAFFELYIIVGPLADKKAQAFAAALLFAQEYGILAASTEDRPFVPVSTVVLEGAPKDLKAVFRRWDDNLVPTAALLAGKPKRGRSLKIVPLSAAIAATSQ